MNWRVNRLLPIFVLALAAACAKISIPVKSPEAPILSLTVSPAPSGESLQLSANDTVMAHVLVGQPVAAKWFDYSDPYSCVQWIRDAKNEDILEFEQTFCPTQPTAPAASVVAFSLTLSPDPSDEASALILADDGSTVGKLTLNTDNADVEIVELCSGDYDSACALTFDSVGHWQTILGSDGMTSLSF